MKEEFQYENFRNEVEARWRLVETAWQNNISPQLLDVEYDELGDLLFIKNNLMRRVDVTSSRDALNGYQKGKCFYCCADISIIRGSINLCHVDHLVPHSQTRPHLPANINGVWNLVLACTTCNGAGEKWNKVPDKFFLERLNTRNEYYIKSNLPLAEAIINQTGSNSFERKNFLNKHYKIAQEFNQTGSWSPSTQYPCNF